MMRRPDSQLKDQTCRSCRHRVGHWNSHFACAIHLDYKKLGVPFDCDDHRVAGSTARPQRSEDGRSAPATLNQKYRFNQAKTAQNALRFGLFFARVKRAVFFICRVVARQMTAVNRSNSINPEV